MLLVTVRYVVIRAFVFRVSASVTTRILAQFQVFQENVLFAKGACFSLIWFIRAIIIHLALQIISVFHLIVYLMGMVVSSHATIVMVIVGMMLLKVFTFVMNVKLIMNPLNQGV